MSKQVFFLVIACILGCFSCKNNGDYHIIRDGGLTVKAIQLPSTEDGLVAYKALLTLDKTLIENKVAANDALWYKMDSCFYIQNGIKKIYPMLIQPVANGSSLSYEYLIEFEDNDCFKKNEVTMMYVDKYINHKTYRLNTEKK